LAVGVSIYVAMTRAQELLVFSGAAASFSEKSSIEECSNWFDWLPLLVPELRDGVSEQVVMRQDWRLQVRVGEMPSQFQRVTPKIRVMEKPESRYRARQLDKESNNVPNRIWSVSEWVERLADEQGTKRSREEIPYRVQRKNSLEAYEWGHVLHRVLEHLQSDHDLEYVREHLLKMALASVGLTSQEARVFAWEKLGAEIVTYMNSDLHKECCQGKRIYSEMPFAVRLFEDVQERGTLSLNGVIDKVWLRADGKATVVDFKTHKYKSATQVKRIVEKYTPQLQLYAYAVEKLLHWRVDRAGLYMTATGSYMEVPCDLQAREDLWKKMQILWTKTDSRSEEKEKRLFS
ncbi:PD-(D/E)XK nuclease family protein, partial [Brevibacillus agri]|uniref:PD-(D/E)XK nuclease family protein n=2 Tax=Brevibacillus agri TaxID=51101 RepID=UPI003D1E36A3